MEISPATATTLNPLVASREEMKAELRSFAAAALSQVAPGGRPRTCLEAFNTVVRPGISLGDMIREILDNPLNVIEPLVHIVGPQSRPIYMVHGADGEVSWFLRHLMRLTTARPIFGIMAPGWYGEAMPSSLEELAARHVKAIRSMQPVGPYTLSGYSSGGCLAMEMAAQLEADGEKIDGLFLVEPMISLKPVTIVDIVNFRKNQVRRHLNPKHEPYIKFGEHSTDDILAGLRKPTLPAEPTARRFYRGLHILVAGSVGPAPLWPVEAKNCVVIRTPAPQAMDDPYEHDLGIVAAVLHNGFTVRTVPGPHAQIFEQPELLQEMAGFLADTT